MYGALRPTWGNTPLVRVPPPQLLPLRRARRSVDVEEFDRTGGRDRHDLRGDPLELEAEELKLAARALGRVTGAYDVEDVLDVVFRDFCVGK